MLAFMVEDIQNFVELFWEDRASNTVVPNTAYYGMVRQRQNIGTHDPRDHGKTATT